MACYQSPAARYGTGVATGIFQLFLTAAEDETSVDIDYLYHFIPHTELILWDLS